MLEQDLLNRCVAIAVSELIKVKNLLALYYDYSDRDKKITFSLVVKQKLDEDDIEEARIAQTELGADFPDGQMEIFQTDQYLICNHEEHTLENLPGELFYESKEMQKLKTSGIKIRYQKIATETTQ